MGLKEQGNSCFSQKLLEELRLNPGGAGMVVASAASAPQDEPVVLVDLEEPSRPVKRRRLRTAAAAAAVANDSAPPLDPPKLTKLAEVVRPSHLRLSQRERQRRLLHVNSRFGFGANSQEAALTAPAIDPYSASADPDCAELQEHIAAETGCVELDSEDDFDDADCAARLVEAFSTAEASREVAAAPAALRAAASSTMPPPAGRLVLRAA